MFTLNSVGIFFEYFSIALKGIIFHKISEEMYVYVSSINNILYRNKYDIINNYNLLINVVFDHFDLIIINN